MDIAAHRTALGSFGEDLAASFLARRGASVVSRNVRVGRGELDLVVEMEGTRVAVEVKTAIQQRDHHPADAFTDRKAAQVAALARAIGIRRVDLVTVAVSGGGVDVVWTPRIA